MLKGQLGTRSADAARISNPVGWQTVVTITPRQVQRFSQARRAAALVLALLAHLLVMASPLHAEPIHGDGAAVHAEDAAGPLHCPECAPIRASSAHPNRTSDCAIESVAPPTSRVGRALDSLASSSWLIPTPDELTLAGAAPRAIRPPEPASSLAFLQVFRL